ncbi:MAG: sulfurtransferase-like selenium metabolism protein YedF [Spirochaetes bacterium]|nr:sulfurtransferase-like selenium metabolism protein YedF [Spirochaetota bacterium]
MEVMDMRGQPCPIPVVKAKKALGEAQTEGVTLLVDNKAAVQNLEKMALGSGFGFSYTEEGAAWRVNIAKGAAGKVSPGEQRPPQPQPPSQPADAGGAGRGAVAFISSDSMGRGAEDLGRLLMKGFIFSLSQLETPPAAVIFINSGALLAAKGASTVADLQVLEERGCRVCVCGACANYYKITESLAVGGIVDMMFITECLTKASGLITI